MCLSMESQTWRRSASYYNCHCDKRASFVSHANSRVGFAFYLSLQQLYISCGSCKLEDLFPILLVIAKMCLSCKLSKLEDLFHILLVTVRSVAFVYYVNPKICFVFYLPLQEMRLSCASRRLEELLVNATNVPFLLIINSRFWVLYSVSQCNKWAFPESLKLADQNLMCFIFY